MGRGHAVRGYLDPNRALGRRQPGPCQIKAAIAVCHMLPPVPDWPQILSLYDDLLVFEPTPVVEVNRAVALAGTLDEALMRLDGLARELDAYQPYHAARAASFWPERAIPQPWLPMTAP